jgi:hypothetical protein
MPNKFRTDDIVKIVGCNTTILELGGSRNILNHYVGREAAIDKYYSGNVYLLTGIPYSFVSEDLKMIKESPRPRWADEIYDMGRAKNNSHMLNYTMYNAKFPSRAVHNWKTGGYCFQSYSSSLNQYRSADRLQWDFYTVPSANFGSTFKLPKSTIRWWFQQWKKWGAFPKGVLLKDLMEGTLDIPCRYRDKYNNMKPVPSNQVYLPVSLCRHVYEYADMLKMVKHLVEKYNMHFIVAVCVAANNPTTSKGHALFGQYICPTNAPMPLYRRVALQARTLCRYFQRRDCDVQSAVFKWWMSVKTYSEMTSPKVLKKELGHIRRTIKSLDDLSTYNPEKEIE